VVSESRVTWANSVPILIFLCLSVLDLSPMYATDVRQTSDAHHRLMPPRAGALSESLIRTVCGSEFQSEGDGNRTALLEKSVLVNGWTSSGVEDIFKTVASFWFDCSLLSIVLHCALN